MSVVNDMLRDLEKRKAPERSDFSGSVPSRESMIEPQKPGAINKYIIAVAVCVVVALVAYGVLGGTEPESSKTVSTMDNHSLTALSNQESKTSSKLVEPVELATEVAETNEAQPAKLSKTETVTKKAKDIQKGSTNDRAKQAKALVPQDSVNKVAQTPASKHKPIATQSSTSSSTASRLAKSEKAHVGADHSQKPKPLKTKPATTLGESKKSSKTDAQLAGLDKSSEFKGLNSTSEAIEKENFKLKLSPEARDEQAAERARKLFQQGRDNDAYQLLESFIKVNQVVVASESLLAQAYLQDRKIDEFLLLLDNAAKPLNPGLQQSKARWLMANNKIKDAVEVLQKRLPPINKYPDHYALLASVYQKLGQHGKAFTTYSELIQFNDQIADWWAGLGLSADQLGQSRQAKVAYQQALAMKGLNVTLAKYIQQRLRAPEMTR